MNIQMQFLFINRIFLFIQGILDFFLDPIKFNIEDRAKIVKQNHIILNIFKNITYHIFIFYKYYNIINITYINITKLI